MTNILLLDGGLGQEISLRSQSTAHPLWSTQVMQQRPELVVDVHKQFIASGAKIITLNNYCTTRERLSRHQLADQFEILQQLAIDAAQQAIADTKSQYGNIRLAGCLPPLCASYHPETTPDFETCLASYTELANIQASAVDLLICETMSSSTEAIAAAQAGLSTGVETWVAFCLKDGNDGILHSGEKLEDALKAMDDLDNIGAVLLNCSTPETISHSMPLLAQSGYRFGAYANGFTSIDALDPGGTVDSLSARTDMNPQTHTNFVLSWVEQGATILGGCCEISPAHIAHLALRLRQQGHCLVSS